MIKEAETHASAIEIARKRMDFKILHWTLDDAKQNHASSILDPRTGTKNGGIITSDLAGRTGTTCLQPPLSERVETVSSLEVDAR